jgi:palmitoyltransferase ZDHHC13/17
VDAAIKHAASIHTSQSLANWINEKTSADGFTALHFASFKGSTVACDLLIRYGADMNARNNFGINMLHVAAQGDQPVTLFYFKQKGLDLQIKDDRGSTPLHWACFSKSEVAQLYLLAWLPTDQLNDKDCDGYTPLHLAVKSVDSLKTTRPVRSLLIRGASRDAVDNENKKPIDLVELVTDQ